MNKYEKSIMFNLLVMKIFFVVISIVNIAIPLFSDGVWRFNVFQFIMVGIWFYALLCALGWFCITTNDVDGDMEILETKTPLLPIVFTRVVEGGFYWITAASEFNWKYFGIVILIDLVFFIFLILDKASYGYARSV